MTNKEALDNIYNKLQDGYEYGYMIENVRYPYFRTAIEVHDSNYYTADKKYIAWTHAGSSANLNTKKDLSWVIKTIFGLTPIEFLSRYEERLINE